MLEQINIFAQILEDADLLTERASAALEDVMDEILSVSGEQLAARRGVAFGNDWPLPEQYAGTPVARTWLRMDDFMSQQAGEQAVEMFAKGLMGYQANMAEAIMQQIGSKYAAIGNPEFEALLDELASAVIDANDGELSKQVMGLIEERRLWDTAEALILFDRGVKLHQALLGFQVGLLSNR